MNTLIEQILLEKKKKSIDKDDLFIEYQKRAKASLEDFHNELDKLLAEGDVCLIFNRYYLVNHSKIVRGKLQVKPQGYAFLLSEDNKGDVFIRSDLINGAFSGDYCLALTERSGFDNREGSIIKIIKRGYEVIVGTIKEIKKTLYVIPDNERIDFKIVIPKSVAYGAMPGHKVQAIVKEYVNQNLVIAEVKSIIGHKNDPGVDILSIVYQHDIPTVFSDDIMKEANDLPDEVLNSDFEKRRDLSNELIVTIDGDDTKDIDDAIGIKELPDGRFKLFVSIADVSHYVKPGMNIDLEAYLRGTSVYLVDRVIPMLPHKLSNGICSLNPGVLRKSITCEMIIDHKGYVVEDKIYPSIIRSRAQMTYQNVNRILNHDEEVIKKYDFLGDIFFTMEKLAKILLKKRIARGSILFETTESKIICDDEGHPLEIKLYERGFAEQIIEEFMLTANETVAKRMSKYPFLYRIHENPDFDKLSSILSVIKNMGYDIKENPKNITVKSIQKFLKTLEGKKEERAINTLLLRAMAKARYSDVNEGHFGLAFSHYTHFTSPIRRYPDLIVHRLIREFLFEHNDSLENQEKWEKKLSTYARWTSYKEKEATDCERDVEQMKKAEYMSMHIGSEATGMISGVTSFGFFVELDNTVEGLVHISTLDGYYEYDERNMMLISGKKQYRIGDMVKIVVFGTNKTMGQIDFILAEKRNLYEINRTK